VAAGAGRPPRRFLVSRRFLVAIGPARLHSTLDMESLRASSEKQSLPPVGLRVLASLPFFGVGLLVGSLAARTLWERYVGPMFSSFGFRLNFGILKLSEPWASWFVLICSALFIWAGCSLVRRGGGFRVGAVVGVICFIVLLLALVAAGWF
jgi:hypothetical protein